MWAKQQKAIVDTASRIASEKHESTDHRGAVARSNLNQWASKVNLKRRKNLIASGTKILESNHYGHTDLHQLIFILSKRYGTEYSVMPLTSSSDESFRFKAQLRHAAPGA